MIEQLMGSLPFRVVCVRDEALLGQVCALRAACYGVEFPHLRAQLGQADALDRSPDTLVLAAVCKQTARVLGSCRAQFNFSGPLQIERHAPVPPHLAQTPRCEITRMVVAEGAPATVLLCLLKAMRDHSLARGVEVTINSVRNRALIRLYQGLGFTDLSGQADWVAMPHVANLPHRVMVLHFRQALTRLQERKHALAPFFASALPDIESPDASLPLAA